MRDFNTKCFGWQPDYPDFRDLGLSSIINSNSHEQEKLFLGLEKEALKVDFLITKPLPTSVDLTKYCSPITHQGDLQSCTAHAGASLIEYYENKIYGAFEVCSRLFLYKATRNYMRMTGDFGANPRSTMAAMVLFGVPPEKYLPYNEMAYDAEPSSFLYSFAQNYKTIKYFRFDRGNNSSEDVVKNIKFCLAHEVPAMCGFSVYSCYNQNDEIAAEKGKIPFPTKYDKLLGGHAISIFGYNDEIEITNNGSKENNSCKGAFLVKNSWGKEWGQKGYGWLPYEYFLKRIAVDCWSIIKKEWVDTNNFANIEVKK